MYKIGAVAIMATVLVIGGCGSDDSSDSPELTKDEYIAAADEICTATEKRFDAIPELTTLDEQAFQTWRDQNVAALRDNSAQLRELTPPAADAAELDEFYDSADAFIDKLANVSFADFVAGTLDREPAPSSDYGFTVCFVDDAPE